MLSPLRKDLQFDRVETGSDGLWIYRIYDPVSEKFFKISQQVYEIISSLSVSKDLSGLEQSMSDQNTPYTREDIAKVLVFLKTNNLLLAEPVKNDSKSVFGRIIQSYLYFKFPFWYPDRFLEDSKFAARTFLNRYIAFFLTLSAILGFMLLGTAYDNFLAGIRASLNFSKIKLFLPVLIVIKVLHELSHAYTAKILGCKVRSIGIAFIFLTPRFYTDVSDMVILERKSRIKIAAAGMWTEFIIAGFACFFFISTPLHSTVSQISIVFIMISLVSSLFFNGNPFMKFDGYYVLKELLETDNLYSKATLAVKAFWRRLLLGLKTEYSMNLTLLLYGHLSLIYRIFLYSLIVILIYHFFIPAVGITLAIIEVWIFFIKPLVSEIIYIYKNRRLISNINKFSVLSLFGGIVYLLVMEVKIPERYPASFATEQKQIRAEVEGRVIAINDSVIILENEELQLKADQLKLDLTAIQVRQQQMLSAGNYALLNLSKSIENRLRDSLRHIQEKLDKMTIELPQESYLYLDQEKLIGSQVKAGDVLAYTLGEMKLYAYLDAGPEDEILENYIYFKKRFRAVPCRKINSEISNVKFTIPQLSSVYGGPVQTDNSCRPLKPIKRVEFILLGELPEHDLTCTIVRFRETRLIMELRSILFRFFHC